MSVLSCRFCLVLVLKKFVGFEFMYVSDVKHGVSQIMAPFDQCWRSTLSQSVSQSVSRQSLQITSQPSTACIFASDRINHHVYDMCTHYYRSRLPISYKQKHTTLYTQQKLLATPAITIATKSEYCNGFNPLKFKKQNVSWCLAGLEDRVFPSLCLPLIGGGRRVVRY